MVIRTDRRKDGQRYTLAQFARRAGISEGRARALWNESRLPRPDGQDVDGRPWWLDMTIDGWCKSTGRALPADVSWPHDWPDATSPAPVVFRGEVQLGGSGFLSGRVYVIAWDTPRGHVVHVSSYAGEHVDPHNAARAAAHVLEPVFWSDAVVLVPRTVTFGPVLDHAEEPHMVGVEAFRLRPGVALSDDEPVKVSRFRQWVDRTIGDPWDDEPGEWHPDHVPVEQMGWPFAKWIARVIGRPVPLWLDGTCTPASARKLSDTNTTTFTVEDTTTNWPATRERLAAAAAWGMHTRLPLAFAAMAEAALDELETVENAHRSVIERDDGGYLVARPARPEWSIELEHLARSAVNQFDDDAPAVAPEPAAIENELRLLRQAEADEPWDETLGEALSEACELLSNSIRGALPQVVAETPTVYGIDLAGPVAEQYLAACEPLGEAEQERLLAHPTRRVLRLLLPGFEDREMIRRHGWLEDARARVVRLYTDPAGRMVLEARSEGVDRENRLYIEWPRTMPTGWNEQTIVAGDSGKHETGLFALTPAADGAIRVDPVPNPGDEPRYTWGYEGTGPTTVYEALLRCAVGTWGRVRRLLAADESSELWRVISTTDGPLRMTWPQVQAWARADLDRASEK